MFIGVPKNGSQTARAVLGQIGVELVGEMGRHPTVPEAIRLAEARFPGEVIAPTAIYAFWRDPVERFCSAVEFHKRCLPNSFIQLFPERFAGIEPHPRWFETDADAVKLELRAVIGEISPVEILAALPPPPAQGVSFQPRGGNLSFYRPQTVWLDCIGVTLLPFADYDAGMRAINFAFAGEHQAAELPLINVSFAPPLELDAQAATAVCNYYASDLAGYS
jgi:hypothetical protein